LTFVLAKRLSFDLAYRRTFYLAASMKDEFKKLVAFFGSQKATCDALSVKQGTVSGWVRGLHGCSAEVAMRAEIATGGAILARNLCPGIPLAFGHPATTEALSHAS